MRKNDLIQIEPVNNYLFKSNLFTFQKFSLNNPLNCDSIYFDMNKNLILNEKQSTIVVLDSELNVKEFTLVSVNVLKLDKLTDKI